MTNGDTEYVHVNVPKGVFDKAMSKFTKGKLMRKGDKQNLVIASLKKYAEG